MNSPFDFYPDQHSSLSRSRPDTAPLTYLNVEAMSPIFEHGVEMGLTESNTSSIGHLKRVSSFPSRHPQPPGVAGLPLLHERSVRPPVAASKLGLPYLEEQGKLLKRNHALERALRRMNEELTRLRGIEQAGTADAERAQQELCARYEAALAAKELEAERHRLEAEAECERQREAMSSQMAEEVRLALDRQLLELSGSAEERAAAREKQAKEHGLQRLQRQVARRILHQGLANGWAAWHAFWLAKWLALEKLRQAGRRLRSGVVVDTFEKWAAAVAEARHDAKHAADLEGRELQLREQAMQMEAELAEMRQACRLQLHAAEEAKRLALERQRIELLGTAQEQAAMREEQAREARIDWLRRQVARRILHQGLANGWAAWHDMWRARRYAHERLRTTANRLRTPQLAAALDHWVADAVAAREARRQSEEDSKWGGVLAELARLTEELHEVKAESDRRLLETAAFHEVELRRVTTELSGSAEQKAALAMEQAHRERVELLCRRAGRRMLRRDVSAAWSSWTALCERRSRARQAKLIEAQQERLGSIDSAASSLQSELREVVLEYDLSSSPSLHADCQSSLHADCPPHRAHARYEKKLAAAERIKETALERLRSELTGSAAELMAMREEQAREARVELLRRQVGRRILHQGLANGWAAWHDMWRARVFAMERLRRVSNRLRTPALERAFGYWGARSADAKQRLTLSAQQAREATLELERQRLVGELCLVKAEADRRLAAMQAERLALLERVAQLTGGHAEAQSLLEAQEAARREERIELLRRQSARRMLHRGLVWGWSAWCEAYEARRYALGRLRAASHRLQSPELSSAFEHWRLDAAIAKRLATMTTHQTTERALRAELATLQSSLERQLAAAEESKRLALERQHVELTGTAAERAALAQQKDREARVAALTRSIGRRMLNQGLVDGWTAWVALWEARRSSLLQLLVAGNRLRAPALSDAFSYWARDASDTRRAEELARMEKESRSMEMQLRRARFEAGQLEMVRDCTADDTADCLPHQVRLAHEDELECIADCTADCLPHQVRLAHEDELECIADCTADCLPHQVRLAHEDELECIADCTADCLPHQVRLAHEDELAALRARHDALLDEVQDVKAALAASQSAGKVVDELRTALEAAHLATEIAERLRQEAEEDVAQQRKANQQLLEKLLAAQRTSFEEERRRLREQHGRGSEQSRAHEEARQAELAEAREEARGLREALSVAAQEGARGKREAGHAKERAARAEAELGTALEDRAALAKELNRALEEALDLESELQTVRMGLPKASTPPIATPTPARSPSPKKKTKTSVLGNLDLDESQGALPVSEQISKALQANAVRVLDLFREWDTDGDGDVSRKEFHKAMPALGLDVPKEAVDALFDQWDSDGGGSISYDELRKLLRPSGGGGGGGGGATPTAPAVAKGLKAAAAASKFKALVIKSPGQK